jgi:hypothetical protein
MDEEVMNDSNLIKSVRALAEAQSVRSWRLRWMRLKIARKT